MVELIDNSVKLKQRRSELGQVGFVPTMGNLHAGHLSLVKEAAKKHDTVFISIFVNPTQFGPNEDLKSYPRTLEQDLEKISLLQRQFPDHCFIVFAPKDVNEIYPTGFSTSVMVEGLTDTLCGKSRPGHFQGVTTVVYLLFKLIKPEVAYFGLKDYQQYLVIKKMVKDLDIPVEIVGCPIVREESGLALSSRNNYLNETQKEVALNLSRKLNELKSAFNSITETECQIENILTSDERWDYLEIKDSNTLLRPTSQSPNLLLAGAYYVGKTRLIDNLVFPNKSDF